MHGVRRKIPTRVYGVYDEYFQHPIGPARIVRLYSIELAKTKQTSPFHAGSIVAKEHDERRRKYDVGHHDE